MAASNAAAASNQHVVLMSFLLVFPRPACAESKLHSRRLTALGANGITASQPSRKTRQTRQTPSAKGTRRRTAYPRIAARPKVASHATRLKDVDFRAARLAQRRTAC